MLALRRVTFGTRGFSTLPFAATQVTRLSNGLRVATQKSYESSTTLGVWIDAGSRFETRKTNGTAHFVEHMIFKGTNKRSRIALEQEIENMGSHLNAYTSREQTVFYARLLDGNTPQMMDILSDILLNSKFNKDDIEVERQVILREMEEVEKSPDEVLLDNIHEIAFRDSSLGFTILGSEDNVKTITRDDLVSYVKNNYTSDRMVIVAVGDVDHDEIVKLAHEKFGHLQPGSAKYNTVTEKPYFLGSDLIYRNDDAGSAASFAVVWEGVPWLSPQTPAFMLMQQVLGQYDKNQEGIVPGVISGNRTINGLANKMDTGAVDTYSGFNTCYKDTGLFGFFATCQEVAVKHCVEELMLGVARLSHSVTDEEIMRAKRTLMVQLASQLESTTSIAEDIGRQLLVFGRRVSLEEMRERIDALDAEEIKRVAWKHFHDAEIAVTAFGPLRGMPNYHDLRRKTYLYRY